MSRARDLRTALNDLRPLMSDEETNELRDRLGDLIEPLEEAERCDHQREAREWVKEMFEHDNAGD